MEKGDMNVASACRSNTASARSKAGRIVPLKTDNEVQHVMTMSLRNMPRHAEVGTTGITA